MFYCVCACVCESFHLKMVSKFENKNTGIIRRLRNHPQKEVQALKINK